MNLTLPMEAVEMARSVDRAISAAGGIDLARQADADHRLRASQAAPILDRLGLGELDASVDGDALFVAAESCRVAGRHAFPFPLAAVLAGRTLGGGDRLGVTAPGRHRIDHGDLGEWVVVDLDGSVARAEPVGECLGSKLGPFVVDVALTATEERVTAVETAVALNLASFTVLGFVESAHHLTVAHVTTRSQFGRPLAAFQGVRFQVADLSVMTRGLRESAYFTASRQLGRAGPEVMADAWALRVVALETASEVFRIAHQMHGAIGFCDEHDLSVLSRHVQPYLRIPTALEATTERLTASVVDMPFDSLYSGTPAP